MFSDLGWRKHGRVEASMPGRWRGREAPMPGRFAETVGLDDSFDFFSWEESRPWRGLGRRLLCRAGGAAGLLCQAGAKPPNPHSPPGPCYTCYMCYMGLTRQAQEKKSSCPVGGRL